MTLPRLTPEAIGFTITKKMNDDATPEDHEEADAHAAQISRAVELYLKDFADTRDVEAIGVRETSDAILCPRGHALSGFIFGNFVYGIVHGEGYCSFKETSEAEPCGWPCRANHYVKDPDTNEDLLAFAMPLPYHPDVVRSS